MVLIEHVDELRQDAVESDNINKCLGGYLFADLKLKLNVLNAVEDVAEEVEVVPQVAND